LVPDNLGSAILKGDRYDPRVNRASAELVRYNRCIVDPSRIATPTNKPRMEPAGGYSRASFFAGRTFPSLVAMRREAARWSLDVAGQRIHGTTGLLNSAYVITMLGRSYRPQLPVQAVASQPRDLRAENGAHRAERDPGDQPLVAGSVADLGARETQIVVDHQALLS
jgi:hypothetical protein